jgi:hypothetical protein
MDNKHSNRDRSMAMTRCVKPLSDLVTVTAKSSKWTVLVGRTGRLS